MVSNSESILHRSMELNARNSPCIEDDNDDGIISEKHASRPSPTDDTTTTPFSVTDDETRHNNGSPVVISNRTEGRNTFHRKLLYTAFTMAVYFALGLMPSQTGVAFLDLIYIVDSDIERGSLIFTFSSLGYMLGSMVGGLLFDRFKKEVIFGLCAVMSGLLTIAIPWCPLLPLTISTVFARSLFTGALDAGGTVILLTIWGKGANPYMQALHFMFALGGVFAPLITEPFLLQSSELEKLMERNSSNQSESVNNTILLPIQENLTTLWSNSSVNNVKPVSSIYIPHIIVGIFTAATSVPFLLGFILQNDAKFNPLSENKNTEEQVEEKQLPKMHPIFFLIFAVYFFSYGCTEEVYAAFLMPFVVKYLHWSKSNGAGANSVYWGSFAGGRFLGIFIAKVLSVGNMILVDYVCILLGLFGFLFLSGHSDIAIWVCNAATGVGMASIFASSVTWLHENLIHVNGKVAGFLVVAMSIGTMVNAALVGYLFEELSPIWYVYITLGNTSLSFLVFILLNLFSRRRKQDVTKQAPDVNSTPHQNENDT